jgi:cation diffusion facilitator family transporter
VSSRAVSDPGDGSDAARRQFTRASLVNIVGNAAKILVEAAIGLTFGSVALVADAAHSVADLVASIVVLVWGRDVYADPDESHPHGHQRIEPLAALFVGSVIVLLGLNLLYNSAVSLFEGPTVDYSPFLIGGLAFAMADMYLLYWYTRRVNESVGSTALSALAIDCRNDIYTSIAALVGVIGVFFGYSLLDAAAGGLVSLLVIYQGVEIGRENVSYLIGAAPNENQRREIAETLRAHPDVSGVHDLMIFYDGTDLEVEAHVEVDGKLTLIEAHDIETELVTSIRDFEDIGDVHLHLDPAGIGEWKDATDGTQKPGTRRR